MLTAAPPPTGTAMTSIERVGQTISNILNIIKKNAVGKPYIGREYKAFS